MIEHAVFSLAFHKMLTCMNTVLIFTYLDNCQDMGGMCVSNAYECYELKPVRRRCGNSCSRGSHCCWYELTPVNFDVYYKIFILSHRY